ncbi:MAG: amidohydrolase family protein [Pseudomonadota bacterium]
MRSITNVLLLCIVTLSFSQASADTYVLTGQMLDVRSGKMLQNQVLQIANERIVAISSRDSATIPTGATVFDYSQQFIVPGLIDAHVHLHGNATDHGYRRLADSLPTRTLKGAVNAARTLRAGFTSARMVGAPGFADVALRDAIDSGAIEGPRLRVAGPSIGITGGHCSDNNLLPFDSEVIGEGVADGPWAMRQRVRRNKKFGADVIKTCSTGGVLSKGTEVGAPQGTVEELTALVEEAHSHGLKVAVHAHGASGIRNAIAAGADSVEHASFIDDEGIRMAKKAGTVLVMDIYNTEYILGEGEAAGILPESLEKERRVGATQRESFSRAHAAGVKMVFGTDAGVYPHGDNARQFARMVRFGMTPLEAIRAATLDAAELLDFADDVGELTVGHYADFVVVDANPLDDVSVLENPAAVVKGGQLISAQQD